jgi:hypothetical protein
MQAAPKSVPFHHEDRQWDARFNVQQDEDLAKLIEGIKADADKGKFKYILIGGTEIGTRAYQDDYQIRHVHVAAVFHNRVSKRSILKNWNVKEGNGYYLVPRNRDLPYSGWRNHHAKVFSKCNANELVLFEMGSLPEDLKRKRVEASEEEKKLKLDDILIDMRSMIEEGKDKEAFAKYPRNFLQYGEKLKALITQRRDQFKSDGNPHIWLYGYPGTGKTAILSYIYPDNYKKNLHNKFFDLYDPKVHTHVLLEDLDHEAVERLSINFIKTICDEVGFSIDQKYKTPQLARTVCLVTSNFAIHDIMPEGKGVEENKQAVLRRFWHINILSLLRLLGLKLLPKDQRNELQRAGNTDSGKLFLTWDYMQDVPLGQPLRSPTYYQDIIKNAFYKD